jgi:hypothetical protein
VTARESLRGRAQARPFLLPLVAALLAAAQAAAIPATGSPAPRAVLRDAPFDFGRVRKGEKVVHAFRIHNGGNAKLEFKGASLSMPGMSCRISPPLEPGADGTISVEWATGQVQGRLRGTVNVATNDPANPSIDLALSGRVVGPLDIDPIPGVFLSTFRDEGVRRELTLTSNEPGKVVLRAEPVRGAHYAASLQPAEAGRTWKLTVGAAPQTPPGRYDETLRLVSDSPAIGTVDLPVHVYVKADLYANPDDVDFGDIPLAAARRQSAGVALLAQTFFVKSRAKAFRVVGIRSDVAALDLRVAPAGGASGSFQVDASLRPAALAPGPFAGTITIETDDPDFKTLTVRVRGHVTQ